ncbi:MAG: SMC family ATPase [archaeon]
MLEIESVRLHNWRSHERSEFKFSPGTNVLLGIMGSGKSSLVSAIVFAFFGETPDTRARRAKLDDLVRTGAESAEVELAFSVSGRKHTILREISRGKGSSNAELRSEGKLVEGPLPAKVTGAIESLTGLDYSLFNQAVYLEQNQIDSFLWAGKGGRRGLLDGFFGIEKIEDARKTLLTVTAKFRTEAEILGRENFSEKLAAKKNELALEEAALAESKGSLEGAAEEFSRVSAELGRISVQVREIEGKIRDSGRLNERARTLQERVRGLEEKLAKHGGKTGTPDSEAELAALEAARARAEKLARERAGLLARKTVAGKRIETLSAKLAEFLPEIAAGQAENDLKEAERELLENSSELSDCKRELARIEAAERRISELEKLLKKDAGEKYHELAGKISELSGKISSTERELAEISASLELVGSKEKAECPVCGSRLTHEKFCEIRADKARRKELLEHELSKTTIEEAASEKALIGAKRDFEAASKIEAELSELGKIVSRKGSLEKKVPLLEGCFQEAKNRKESCEKSLGNAREARKLRTELSEQEGESRGIETELEKTRDELASLPDLGKIAREISEKRALAEAYRISAEATQTRKDAEEAEAAARKISTGFSEGELPKLRDVSEGLSRKTGSLQYALKELPGKISAGESRIMRLGGELSEVEEKGLRKERIQAALDLSKQIDRALKETEQILRNETISEINSALASFWRLLYPYGNYSSARLSTEENDYILELLSGNAWQPAERIASGGEKSIGCLALRIAFSKTLAPGTGLLIFDEPTHNLDSNAISLMTGVFREGISEIAPQAILITHEEALEAAATGNCYRLEREGANQATVVTALDEGER